MSFDLAISVQNLTKCFEIYDKPRDRLLQMMFPRRKFHRDFVAVKDVSFTVKRGEAVAIIGRNGSGKSTLLQMVCGTLNPSSGSIQINGKVAALLELGAGFNPEFTGRENVYLSASIYGLSEVQISNRFAKIEAFAEIGDFIDQPVKTYSSGMFVRLAFAVIAHVDADILVIDEALAVGDVFFTQKCMRFIRQFMETGSLLFVSHDTNSVMSFCENAIWLENGEIKHSSNAKFVCEKYLEAFYANDISPIKAREEKTSLEEISTCSLVEFKDSRQDYVVHTNLRTEIEFSLFDKQSSDFGVKGARVLNAYMTNSNKEPLLWALGGEQVQLTISGLAIQHIKNLIVGFVVRNKNGQNLFGDNTCVHSDACGNVDKLAGEHFQSKFVFIMPRLPAGDYVISIALAEGTQSEHVIHQWIHDAIVFKSHSNSVSAGLVGIPVHIELS